MMACGSSCFGELFIFLFILFSTPVYVAFLATIVKKRHHEVIKSSFFHIAFVLGIADLVFAWQTYLITVGPRYMTFYSRRSTKIGGISIARLGFYLRFFSKPSQAFGIILMTISRMVVVVKPFTHELILTPKRIFWSILLVQVVVPLLFSLTSISCSFIRKDSGNGTEMASSGRGCFSQFDVPIMILFLATAIFVIISYGVMLVQVIKQHKQTAPAVLQQSNMQSNVQWNMTVASSMISGLLVLCCIALYVCPAKSGCTVVRHAVEMVFCMSNPFIMIFMSTAVRENFVVKIGTGH